MAPTAARACLCACIALGLCSMALAAGSSPSPPASSPSSSSPPSSSSSTTKSSSSPGRSASASLALLGSATALGFMSAGRAPLVVLLVAAAMLQGAAAQVSEQETTLPSTTDIIATKPKVDCSVTWSETWTKCSPDGTQSRRYTVDVYPTRAGKQCPPPETRPCTYPGPETIMVDGSVGTWGTKDCAQRRKMLAAYTGESHESFTMSAMCQYAPLKVTVGDVVVFKKASPSDDVFMLPSQWHYAVCNFTDGGSVLPADASSSDTELRYTIRPEDKDKRLYLGSSRADACSMGQRILISVDDFKQGTLAEALDLLNKKEYETEEGAQNMIERIWCFEDHCPTPALGFYEGNLEWAKERCVADAYSLLGFVYRKKPNRRSGALRPTTARPLSSCPSTARRPPIWVNCTSRSMTSNRRQTPCWACSHSQRPRRRPHAPRRSPLSRRRGRRADGAYRRRTSRPRAWTVPPLLLLPPGAWLLSQRSCLRLSPWYFRKQA